VVFSDDAEGVQISHVSDATIEGAKGRLCAILSKTSFNDRLRCAEMKVSRRVEERCTFKGLLVNVAHPGRAVETQSSHTHLGGSSTFISVAYLAKVERRISACLLELL
jgi:hypothetical protein